MPLSHSRKEEGGSSPQAAHQVWEGRLKALIDEGTAEGVPEDIARDLLAEAEGRTKSAPPALLWALCVECRSASESRLFLQSVGKWVHRVRAPKGMKAGEAQLLVGSVQALRDEGTRWQGLAWLLTSPVPALAKSAWQAILSLRLEGVVGPFLRNRLVVPKVRQRIRKLFGQEMKRWARAREVGRDPSSVAQLLLGLEADLSPGNGMPGWLTELLQFKDVLWAGHLLAALVTSGGDGWREAIFRWLATSEAFGPTLHCVRLLCRSGSPPKEDELRRFIQGRAPDRNFIFLRELVRESEREGAEALLIALARLATQSPAVLNDHQRNSLAQEIHRVSASVPYDQEIHRTVSEILAQVVSRDEPGSRESAPLLLGLASDRGLPPDRREATAMEVLAASPERFLEVARAVSDISPLAHLPLLDRLYGATLAEVQRCSNVEPLLQVMLALRENPAALRVFGERCAQTPHLPALAEAILNGWKTQGMSQGEVRLIPEDIVPIDRMRKFLARELAQRGLAAASPEEELVDLAWLARLEANSERLARLMVEVSHERARHLVEVPQSRLEELSRRFNEEQVALRAAHRRDQEQQIADLLAAASAVWTALQEIEADTDERQRSRLGDAWSYLGEFFAKYGYRPFPDILKVPFNLSVHEYRDESAPPPRSPVRVVRLGLERSAGGGWVLVQKAIVASV